MPMYAMKVRHDVLHEIVEALQGHGEITGFDPDGAILFRVEAPNMWSLATTVREDIRSDLLGVGLTSEFTFEQPEQLNEL